MRYFLDKRLVCVLFFLIGLVLSAAGLRDLTIALKPWQSDFVFGPADSPQPVTFATAHFVGRPYSGLARLVRRSAFDKKGFHLTVTDTSQQAEYETGRSGDLFVDTLKISQYGEDESIRLFPGAEILLNDSIAIVSALRPFVGLWPDPRGIPMASVSIRLRDSWAEDVMLRSDRWLNLEGGLTMRFLWCENEEEARRLVETGRPGIETARWGVHDEGRTHWFNSFIPGTGVQLADGRVVTLRGLDGVEAAIEVDVLDHDDATSRRIQANTEDLLIVFEYPSLEADLLLLYAWSDTEVLAAYLSRAGDSSHEMISIGRVWKPGVGEFAIRLERVSRAAVPVEAGQESIFEAVLELASSRVRVRQGEAVRLGDALLRYSRVPKESAAVYRVRLVGAAGEEPYFLLEPDRPYTFSTAYGTFTLRHEDLHFDAGLTLRPVGIIVPLRLELGIACMVLAMAGLALIRRAAR
ncbi:MAG: hypothetical protein IID09_06755 [Candidatus Hydrogenedentes bacterium]|nr:hypothetical protein [Candidatus Hydrogenedentota bacterium]